MGGVDALWITPWYPSPMADGGYDVADYCDIHPDFGDLEQATALLDDAHHHGMRVPLDLVANHTSDHHPWFRRAASDPSAPERDWYWTRRGRGAYGELPPNNWKSVFGGSAWSKLDSAVKPPRTEWYLHLFTPAQPDLNWDNPGVAEQFDHILRFWFDRGVDGLRIDVAHGLTKHPDLPDLAAPHNATPSRSPDEVSGAYVVNHPHWDRDDVHRIFRRWREIADSYASSKQGARIFVAEAWRTRKGGLPRYLRADELHTAFNFDFLKCPWDADLLQATIETQIRSLATVGATPTWVLSSHDLIRPVTRFGSKGSLADLMLNDEPDIDLEVGCRRARAAALLMLALPGSAFIYQGEELGLPEVFDIAPEARQDPISSGSGVKQRGRDGCRVPLPWSGELPALGFSNATPWLPQPAWWAQYSVDQQESDPSSMLTLYRRAIHWRRRHLTIPLTPELDWLDSAPGVLAFRRGDEFQCVVNASPVTVDLPSGSQLVMASGELPTKGIPPDTTVWLHACGPHGLR
nr:alpha-amylase family glycosyl hydrolase [Phytoactinopolyspora mesophila]